MDKQDLKLFSFLIIPGFMFLWTLSFDLNDASVLWFIRYNARLVISILCLLIGGLSFLMLITKKYKTEDSIQDLKDKKKKTEMVIILSNFLDENGLQERYTKNNIIDWVEKTYKK